MFTEAQWSKIDKLLNCIRVFNSDLEETSNIYILSISFHLQYTYFSIFLSLTTGKMANIIGLAENQIVKPAENYSPLSKNLILSHDPVLLNQVQKYDTVNVLTIASRTCLSVLSLQKFCFQANNTHIYLFTGTLQCQGGPMLAEEATLFEKRPDFQVQINYSRLENDDIRSRPSFAH